MKTIPTYLAHLTGNDGAKSILARLSFLTLLCFLGSMRVLAAENQTTPSNQDRRQPAADNGPDFGGGPGFDGPPPFGPGPGGFGGGPGDFGPGGFGRGGFGPGGMGMRENTKLVAQFDKDGDGRLNAAERQAAREYLSKQNTGRGMRGRGFGFPGQGEDSGPIQPGVKLSPSDVKSFPGAPVYDPQTLRTLFLQFENADWEKELATFYKTDVEVPARLTVDGKTYEDVGVHFRGNTSFMMVGEGRKRSMGLSLDFVNKQQRLGTQHSLTLLNSHEDPSFLHTVLFCQIAGDYIAAPKANFVRVVINGENWGVYISVQPFNKDFVKEHYGTTKGARWKVPGSPNGRGGLAYLGDDVAAYKRIYELKTKDDPKAWANFIHLCKVLNETPAEQLEAALAPLLDIDGALKFLAVDNAVVNGDGFWTRASDYCIYQDEKGQFHLFPHDINETLSVGGPGGPGGPGGRGGPGGPRFGPGMLLGSQMLTQADKNNDQQVSKEEFASLAETWFAKLDPEKSGKVNQEQFTSKLTELLPPPAGFNPPGGGGMPGGPGPGGRGGFGMAFIGPGLFTALDANKDGTLTQAELKDTFARWFDQWDTDKKGVLNGEKLSTGLAAALPRPDFGGRGGGFGGRGGRGFRGGPGGPGGGGVELDPLVALNDSNKPLITKLLAVPALRTRYLGYVRDIAQKWFDWNKLGPIAQQYHALIEAEVKRDTRKLYSTEAFLQSLTGESTSGAGGTQANTLKSFIERRRAYLLNYKEGSKSSQ